MRTLVSDKDIAHTNIAMSDTIHMQIMYNTEQLTVHSLS